MAALSRVPTCGGQHRYLVKRNEESPAQDTAAGLATRGVATERAKRRLRAEGADQGCGYRVLHLFLLSLLVRDKRATRRPDVPFIYLRIILDDAKYHIAR